MKKIVQLIIASVLVQPSVFAITCNSNNHGWGFSGVSIDASGMATCSYRYCYYGCTGDSYQLDGCFKPATGPWSKEDNRSFCYDSSNKCQLTTASCS